MCQGTDGEPVEGRSGRESGRRGARRARRWRSRERRGPGSSVRGERVRGAPRAECESRGDVEPTIPRDEGHAPIDTRDREAQRGEGDRQRDRRRRAPGSRGTRDRPVERRQADDGDRRRGLAEPLEDRPRQLRIPPEARINRNRFRVPCCACGR